MTELNFPTRTRASLPRLRTDTPACLVRLERALPPAWQLVCLPYAGGSAAIYHDWPSRLPADVELITVELPGRGRRFSEAPQAGLSDVLDEVVPALAQAIHRPYVLFGHSMGALLAYEIALALTRHLGGAPVLLVVSASRAPDVPLRRSLLHDLPTPDLQAALRRLGGTSAEILDTAEAFTLFEPVLRADFRLAENYLRSKPAKVDAPLLVIGAVDDTHVEIADLQGWDAIATYGTRFHHCAGGHFFMRDTANCVAELVASMTHHLLVETDARKNWCEAHAG